MSEKLPVVRGDRLCRALERSGFALLRVTGSHHIYGHVDGRRTSVPVHARGAIKPGILKSILKAARITADELRALL